jgi:alpha-glucosidase
LSADGSSVGVLLNAGSNPVALPTGRLLLSSQPCVDGYLPPDTSAWISADA